ncbi:MAG: hypothetical protein N2257_03950 [Thermodesulfovibrionales bacterium]|nr:hypothetical protein [Thermodesulfovibrionales bacterium]
MSKDEKAFEEIYLCPLCGRELGQEERSQNGWLCKCGEFIPEGTQVSSFTGSSDRLRGELHKRIRS